MNVDDFCSVFDDDDDDDDDDDNDNDVCPVGDITAEPDTAAVGS